MLHAPSPSQGARALVGVAGWSLPREEQAQFPADGTHLERYASRFDAVEINSSFYRPHRRSTYERWAASVPDSFRFSVKVPKSITHEQRLREPDAALDALLEQTSGLGARLGCLLVQLPPSLVFDLDDAGPFFERLRTRTSSPVACEPRHASWSASHVDDLLTSWRVARVMADPVRIPGGEDPGGWTELVYYRLHGSPRTYWSSYSDEYLESIAQRLEEDRADGRQAWCIFDNTARNAATANGLRLLDRLAAGSEL